MSKEVYGQLIVELGRSVGLPELTADEDGYCCLGFDDKIILHLQYNEPNDVIMLFSQLGIVDEDNLGLLYPRLMQANLFWQGTGGATLGMDIETREVIMSYQMPLQLVDFPRFQELIEGFINTAELWINTLEVIQTGGDITVLEKGEEAKKEEGGVGGIRA